MNLTNLITKRETYLRLGDKINEANTKVNDASYIESDKRYNLLKTLILDNTGVDLDNNNFIRASVNTTDQTLYASLGVFEREDNFTMFMEAVEAFKWIDSNEDFIVTAICTVDRENNDSLNDDIRSYRAYRNELHKEINETIDKIIEDGLMSAEGLELNDRVLLKHGYEAYAKNVKIINNTPKTCTVELVTEYSQPTYTRVNTQKMKDFIWNKINAKVNSAASFNVRGY